MFDTATTGPPERQMVVCSVVRGPTGAEAHLDIVPDIPRTFARWRLDRQFLPVAAIVVDPSVIESVTGSSVPCRLGLGAAAVLFGHIGIPHNSARAFARQYVHLGADARPLLRAWAEAVA